MSRMLRFNRVEGLFTGIAPSIDFRSAAPGLVRAHLVDGPGQNKRHVEVASSRTGGPRPRLRFALSGRWHQRTISSLPFADDAGFGAFVGSVDDYDYVDRRTLGSPRLEFSAP